MARDTSTKPQRYRLDGLDCANCAATIETSLRKYAGLENAVVSFATGTVALPPEHVDRAGEIIAGVEPKVRIVADSDRAGHQGQDHAHHGHSTLQLVRMIIAATLLAVGIIFRNALRATPYAIAEYAVLISAYLVAGAPVLFAAVRNLFHGRVFDELFLMSIASVGAIAIGKLSEAVAVMLFYAVGEFVQDRAVHRSRTSVMDLMDLRPQSARLVGMETSGETARDVDPGSVETGQIVEVRPGERVPLDGVVVSGQSSVDTSAMTGESIPRGAVAGDDVLSGFVNIEGTIRVRVTRPLEESAVSRILRLVQDAADRKAPTERFISRFAAVYTPAVVVLALLIAFVPPLVIPGATLSAWVYRALVVLVISCPCALVLSIPLSYFGGIGGASRNRILVKGANVLDALKDVVAVALDKTGTVTHGVFQVTATEPQPGFTADELVRWAALAEAHSSHPIARSIRSACPNPPPPDSLADVREERGLGVVAGAEGHTVVCGSSRLLEREGITIPGAGPNGNTRLPGTVVQIAVDGAYAGRLVISDEVKDEAAESVLALKTMGVHRVDLVTGDAEYVAANVAEITRMDAYTAELLPHEKVELVERMRSTLPNGDKLLFAGDGINDAPVLMAADVGVAMGDSGTDAAIEAADVVIMDDDLTRLPVALDIARHTRRVVVQNIVFTLAIKVGLLALGAVGLATMWEAVIADVGVSLLAVLNATRILRFSDRISRR